MLVFTFMLLLVCGKFFTHSSPFDVEDWEEFMNDIYAQKGTRTGLSDSDKSLAILEEYGLTDSIYKLEPDMAVSLLQSKIQNIPAVQRLFEFNHGNKNTAEIHSEHLKRVAKTLPIDQLIYHAFDCFYVDMKRTSSFLLCEYFAYEAPNYLSSSHFIYECLMANMPEDFISWGIHQISYVGRANYMYELVGPERKPILQILIELNRALIIAADRELLFSAKYLTRSMIRWLEYENYPDSPLFWISSSTSLHVVEVLKYATLDFSVKNAESKTVLLHAIEQGCNWEVINSIIAAFPEALNIAGPDGVLPLYLAYQRKDLFALNELAMVGAPQSIGHIVVPDESNNLRVSGFVETDRVIHAAIRDGDMDALKLLMTRPEVYYKTEVTPAPLDYAIHLGNFEAAKVFMLLGEKLSLERTKEWIENLTNLSKIDKN